MQNTTETTTTYKVLTEDAPPFTAQHCPECGEWIFVALGPYAEGDCTKPQRGYEHMHRMHPELIDNDMYPWMEYNEDTVGAILEHDGPSNMTPADVKAEIDAAFVADRKHSCYECCG